MPINHSLFCVLAIPFFVTRGFSQGGGDPLLTTISNDPDLTTFYSLFNATGGAAGLPGPDLEERFNVPNFGPYTAFAPTNEAFGNVTDPVIKLLTAAPSYQLVLAILRTHIAQGSFPADDLNNGSATLISIEGFPLGFRLEDGGTKINGQAMLSTDAPLQAANGIVYKIDQVIDPFIGYFGDDQNQDNAVSLDNFPGSSQSQGNGPQGYSTGSGQNNGPQGGFPGSDQNPDNGPQGYSTGSGQNNGPQGGFPGSDQNPDNGPQGYSTGSGQNNGPQGGFPGSDQNPDNGPQGYSTGSGQNNGPQGGFPGSDQNPDNGPQDTNSYAAGQYENAPQDAPQDGSFGPDGNQQKQAAQGQFSDTNNGNNDEEAGQDNCSGSLKNQDTNGDFSCTDDNQDNCSWPDKSGPQGDFSCPDDNQDNCSWPDKNVPQDGIFCPGGNQYNRDQNQQNGPNDQDGFSQGGCNGTMASILLSDAELSTVANVLQIVDPPFVKVLSLNGLGKSPIFFAPSNGAFEQAGSFGSPAPSNGGELPGSYFSAVQPSNVDLSSLLLRFGLVPDGIEDGKAKSISEFELFIDGGRINNAVVENIECGCNGCVARVSRWIDPTFRVFDR